MEKLIDVKLKNKSYQAPIITEPQSMLAGDVLIELLQHELVFIGTPF